MLVTQRMLNAIVIGFFLIIIAVVFQQIATSMSEQGIATGGPYDNAAAYPRAIALIIAGLLALQLVSGLIFKTEANEPEGGTLVRELARPAGLLLVFALYLATLGWLGYHLTTTPMILAVMWLCGQRSIWTMVLISIGMAFLFAYLFESFLKIVLPGGIFALNIPW